MNIAGKTVLIVDDDMTMVHMLTLLLRKAGYRVLVAQDGASAMMAAQRAHPDMVVLDLGLPAGDGFSVLSNLKMNAHLMLIPVIVVSGMDPSMCRERALQAGAAAYFEKPVDGEALCRTIGEQLQE